MMVDIYDIWTYSQSAINYEQNLRADKLSSINSSDIPS